MDSEPGQKAAQGPRRTKTADQPLKGLDIIGASVPMQELYRNVKTVSQSDVSVLIEGETGVGKNLIARAIHVLSGRAGGPFVPFSAPNLPSELFESELFGHVKGAFSGAYDSHQGLARAAHGGTLFIDEIGELTLANQAKLLGFLDEKCVRPVGGVQATRVDVRLICATNRDLREEVERKAFRRDLYYRLRVVALRVPTLRERQEDLPLLIDHFSKRFARKYGREVPRLSQRALETLRAHDWRGNVRELENELERAVLLTAEGEPIEPRAFSLNSHAKPPIPVAEGSSLQESREAAETAAIEQALRRHGWNVSAAARDLGISRVGLTRKLKKLGIQRPGRRPQETG